MAEAVRRIVRFDAEDKRAYEFIVEAFASWSPGRSKHAAAIELHQKLAKVGTDRPREPRQNPDLTLYTITGPVVIELLESERDMLFDAMKRLEDSLPVFALAVAAQAEKILSNAERLETPAST